MGTVFSLYICGHLQAEKMNLGPTTAQKQGSYPAGHTFETG